MKRQRSPSPSSGSDHDEPPEKKSRTPQASPVQRFAWRWSFSPSLYPDLLAEEQVKQFEGVFSTAHSDIQKVIKARFPGAHFIFQLERGAEGTLHYQGYLHFPRGSGDRPDSVGRKLGVHLPGIWVRAGVTRKPGSERTDAECDDALKRYCMKRDHTYVAGPWADKEIVPPYEGKDLPLEFYPWQETVATMIAEPPHNRQINVLRDPVGGAGKSTLAKRLVFEGKAQWLSIADAKDLACQIVSEGASRAYFIDIPRTCSQRVTMDEIYAIMEQLKNGMVHNTKYTPKKLLMMPPHVWLLTNNNIDRKKMSQDRWKVWKVVDKALVADV